MSDLEETRIRCPSCGKRVPAMKYCIYCGARLAEIAPPSVSPPPPSPLPKPSLPPIVPPPVPSPVRITPPQGAVGIEAEAASLMSSIAAFYERKVALLDVLRSGEVSQTVFSKLYNEYCNKLSDLLNARIRKMDELRSKLEERTKRLTEVTLDLEELEVRRKIGEMDLNVFAQKAEKLKKEEQELRDSLRILRAGLDRLEKMLATKKPSEIRDLESKMRASNDAIQKLASEGKISADTLNTVKSDVEETLGFFDSLIANLKGKERELRERLEILQTRYKLNEVSVEEYERRKRELQEEIDKVWA